MKIIVGKTGRKYSGRLTIKDSLEEIKFFDYFSLMLNYK
ncbi:hypothetical protein D0416_07155 [Staphylococcus epidermidis]|nr:hypothetical protein F9B42_06750 [Staphylococcus epidermidis]KAB2278383.1 hypothetical protein F9B71_11380 [Staphylococcus epidermidis]MBM0766852.1 hypothetical protein [Staphylococcus epidermidis]MBM0778374.1 hypothetical protein [Staphylococcus epidermidis]MBM0786566.1 hypothetical protein [Staphylococcus epidermidis]